MQFKVLDNKVDNNFMYRIRIFYIFNTKMRFKTTDFQIKMVSYIYIYYTIYYIYSKTYCNST